MILVFVTGLSLLLYPTVSDYWNSFHQTKVIAGYAEKVSDLSRTEYDRCWQDAVAYNSALSGREEACTLSEAERAVYENNLNVSGSGVMGYIQIPAIDLRLPIYHGTDEAVLQVAVGHLEWTSLPVGGEGTHCVLSGHRGLPGAKLFTNLDKLVEGDVFTLRVLDEVLSYEVDQILTVEPTMVSDLQIEDGRDYCTLVTCTPYGVNSHRLLVRGHRIETPRETETVRILSEAVQVEELPVAAFMAVPLLAASLFIFFAAAKIRRRR